MIPTQGVINATKIFFLTAFLYDLQIKNSKVFEQKGHLLNFKANIDPRAVLSQIKSGWAESSSLELSQAEPSWAKLSICDICGEFGSLSRQFFSFLLFFTNLLFTLTKEIKRAILSITIQLQTLRKISLVLWQL